MFWIKSRKEVQKDLPQYQRDFDLSPQGDHYMFWEYLEVGMFLCMNGYLVSASFQPRF